MENRSDQGDYDMRKHLIKGLEKISASLDIEFSYTVANHNFELGLPLENCLKSFFKPYFPTRYAFGSGYLVDKNESISNQIDWIIYDPCYYSPLITKANNSDNVEFFPYDCAYAFVEVKRTLDLDVLDKAIQQIQNTKKLKRVLSSPSHILPILDYGPLLNKNCTSIQTNHIISGIYAYSSKDIDRPEDVISLLEKYSFEFLPDFIAIHGKYFIVKVQNFGTPSILEGFRISLLPQQYNAYSIIDSSKNTSSVFYAYLIDRLNNTFLNATEYKELIHGILDDYQLKGSRKFPGKHKVIYRNDF